MLERLDHYHHFWTTAGFGNNGEGSISFGISAHRPTQVGLHPVPDFPSEAFEGWWKISEIHFGKD